MGSCLPVKVGKRKVAGRSTNWDSVNDGGGAGRPVVTACRYFWAIHVPARSGRSLFTQSFSADAYFERRKEWAYPTL